MVSFITSLEKYFYIINSESKVYISYLRTDVCSLLYSIYFFAFS